MKRIISYSLLIILFGCAPESPSGEVAESSNSVDYTISDQVLYQIDPTHSLIEFSIPFWGITQVKGRFDNFMGTILLDGTNIQNSSAELFIEPASINTNHPKRDSDLVKKYLECDQYPIIHFKSTSVTKESSHYKVAGILDMHGTAKEINATFWFTGIIDEPDNIREAGIMLQPQPIDRTDYGISMGLVDKASGREFVGKNHKS